MYRTVFLVLIAILFLWPTMSHAQTPDYEILLLNVVPADKGDKLGLDIFFTVTDGSGQPIQPNIESAEVEVLGGSEPPEPALTEEPNTPFYVVLLLDGSGSMADVVGQMREAAVEAMQITDQFTPMHLEFLADPERIQQQINRVESVSGGETCLYDSIYDSITQLENVITLPQERKAVIAFTDGRDELRTGDPCSRYIQSDVVEKAMSFFGLTPIHTIGLCNDAACSNVDKRSLTELSLDTGGFHATGEANELGNLFKTIMKGLNSQNVARSNHYVCDGAQQAVLRVKLRDYPTPISQTFDFQSPKCYERAKAPAQVQITKIGQYDSQNDSYPVTVGITNPEQVSKLILQVQNSESGQDIDSTSYDPKDNLELNLRATGLEADTEYTLIALLLNEDGYEVLNNEGESNRAERQFIHTPPKAKQPQVDIRDPAVISEDPTILEFPLVIHSGVQLDKYSFVVTDEESSQVVINEPEQVFQQAQSSLKIEVPAAMSQSDSYEVELRNYRLTVDFTTQDDIQFTPEPKQFGFTPKAPPTLWEQYWWLLPVSGVLMLMIVGGSIAWGKISQLTKRSPTLPEPGALTVGVEEEEAGPIATKPMLSQIRLEVVSGKDIQPKTYPTRKEAQLVVGRDPSKTDITIEVGRVSSAHFEVTRDDGQYFIRDVGSRNGTFLNNQKVPTDNRLSLQAGINKVRLGSKNPIYLKINVS